MHGATIRFIRRVNIYNFNIQCIYWYYLVKRLILISFRETLMNGQPLNLGNNGTLPILSPDTYRTGQNIAVTLPPTSIGFWVFTGVQAEPCLAAPSESTAEASNNTMYHNIRSTKSRQYHNLSHSDQEADSHIMNKSRGYEFNDTTGQYKQFSGRIMEDNISETDKGDFQSSNTKMVEEFDMNIRSKSIRRKRDERDRTAQGRYKRNVSESVKYLIPGLQSDYTQANNGITIKTLTGRRNRGDRLQEIPKIAAHESNTHSLLHEPHRHVSSEDVDEGLPGISSGRLKVNSFTGGGIYFQSGGKSSEKRNNDYDYVDKDENVYEEYEYVPSEKEYFHGPTEYFEVFHKPGAAANEKFAGYRGEISEAESIAFMKQRNQEWEQRYDDHDHDYKVIHEQGLTAQDNHKAKSVAPRMPNTYYTEINKQDSSDEGEDFEVQRRIKGKYKIDVKKDASNRRKVEKRNHENDYPDLSSLIAKLKKDATNALGVLNNKYNNIDIPAEQAEITKSSHRIKETATTEQNKNNSSTAEEYYQEGYRTRRLGKENSKMTNQRNDRNVTQHANHENYNEYANHESFNNTEIASSSRGNVQFSKERPRKISHKVVYDNGSERTSSDTRHNPYKQDSKTRLTEKSFQRTVEDSYEDDEKESRASKQRTGNRNENSENNEYNITDDWYVQINPTEVSEADSDERVMKTYSRKIKHHNQQNIGNSRDTDKVHELVSAVNGQKPTESINPNYRMKPSRRELSNPYRIESAPGGMVTQKLVQIEGQSEEESDIQHMKHPSRTEVMTDESKETAETDDKQDEAMARKMKTNKSKQTNQVIIRMPTSNKEARQRVRRDVPSHLPILEALKENRHMWNKNATAHEKETQSETISDSNSAELQMKSQNIKENSQLQTAYTNVPITVMIKSYEDLQLDHSTKPSEGKNADHSTQMYSSLNTYKESSGNEYEKYRELTTEVITHPQQKVHNTLMDRNHQEEYKEPGTNKTYWELHSGGSMEYFMDPKQSKKEGNIKREIGSSLMLEPYIDTNSSDRMMIQGVADGAQYQHASVLRTGSSVQEAKRQSATDISTRETAPPVLMDRNSESKHDTTQPTMIANNEEGTTDVDEDKNAHKDRDGALIVKMYHENLEPARGVIRLPKAIETHINLQHGPRKVTTGGINYNEPISNKEKYKHIKNRIQTHEQTGQTGVWNMGIPVKISEVPPADKSSILLGKVKPSKLENKSTKMLHGLPFSFTFGNSNKGITVSETGASALRKKQHMIRWNQNKSEDTQLHTSEGQYTEEGNFTVEGKRDGQRVGRPYEKTMQRHNETGQIRHSTLKTSSEQIEQEVISDVAKKTFGEIASLETLADNTASKRPFLKNNVKLYTANSDSTDAAPTEPSELNARNATKKFNTINDVRTETLANLKNIHDKMKKAEDKAVKMTHSTTGPRSVQQSSGDGDSDNNGLVHKVNTVTSELKTKNEKEKEHSTLSAEKGLRSKADFTEGKFRILSKKKETDVAHSKLEDITTNYISDGKSVADPLVRSAKDTGHLKYIAAMKENLNLHGLDNTNYNIKLQPSTIPTTDNMRTHLEKRRLEILQALTAQHAKLKDDLLKMRVMAAEEKLKLPHHINRRDTTQNKLTESLMSSSETKDAYAPIYIKNEDHIDSSNKDNPSIRSQNFGDKDSDPSSYTEKSNDKYYSQDIYKLLEQIFLPVSMIADLSDIQVPVLGSQHVYKTQHYSKHDILPSSYVSDKEDQSLVQQSKNFSSGVVPFSVLHDMGPITMYAEGLFPGWHTEEKDHNKENVSQISNLNLNPNQIAVEDKSLGDEHIEIKELSIPLFLPRPVLLNDPMMVESKRMPTSENEIKFFLDSETNEAGANNADLTREESHIPSLLPATRSDSSHSPMNAGETDNASLQESWKLHNSGNIRESLVPVTDKNDSNKVLLTVTVLSGVDSRKEKKENSEMMDEYINKDSNPGRKHLKSSNKRNVSDKSLHNSGLEEAELSKLELSETIEDAKKYNNRCKSCDKHKNTLIFQPLAQDLGNNSELTLQPDNSNTAHIRSERAISYLFNDNLLQPSTMANNKNPRIEDNINDTYWLQTVFNNNSKSSEKKSQTEEINSNMHHDVIMPMSNELIISDVSPNSYNLIGREKFKFNSEDTTPANSLHVTNMKLITDYQTKDFENVTNENRLANQTFLGISDNFLNDIINAAAHSEMSNNKIKDALTETSNDVNLQTNEINRQFRILHRFPKSQHEASTTKSGTEGNTVEIKSIPYKFHKHVLNSNYEPKYKNSKKYSNPHEQQSSAESSDEFPSTIIKLHNRISPSDERSNAIKEVFSAVPEEFPNINNKSKGTFESTVSHDTTTTSEETSRTETEHNEVSKVPSDIMTNNNVHILTEPNVNKQDNGSLIILQTYPPDNLNNLTGSKKDVTTLEQKTHDIELVPNSEEDTEYSDIVHRSTQHKETGNGEQETDYTHREKKKASTTGHIHALIKNISNHIVKFFHNIPPWNYFSPEHTIRPL